MAKSLVSLNFAVADYPHTRAILTGRVPIEGVAPNFIKVEPQIAAYRRMVRNVEFDVCEIAPTTYIMARALGAPFVALPIFVSRGFHHGGLRRPLWQRRPRTCGQADRKLGRQEDLARRLSRPVS